MISFRTLSLSSAGQYWSRAFRASYGRLEYRYKYKLSKLAGPAFATNTFIQEQKAAAADPRNYQDPEGPFSPTNNSISGLRCGGTVFLACHNSIWEQSDALILNGSNPDKLSHEALAAELTNHLIPEVVLTPGAVATLVNFQEAGFHYAT